MPKPLFFKLTAHIAAGFLCVLLGVIIGTQTHDQFLCFLSFAIGGCCTIRCIAFYHIVHSKFYFVLEGHCVKREFIHFKKTQKIYFVDTLQHEYIFNLSKNISLLPGHSYRLYLEKDSSGRKQIILSTQLLGFEELCKDISN